MNQTEQSTIARNKAIRGYIIRSLAKGNNNTLLCRQLTNIMSDDGVVISPDISKYLDYLKEKGYIEFTNKKVTSYTAYLNDATIRLTAKGVDLVEGTIEDAGVDL